MAWRFIRAWTTVLSLLDGRNLDILPVTLLSFRAVLR